MDGIYERQRNALDTIIAMLVAMMAYWSRGRYIRDLPDYLDWDDIIRQPDESEFPPLERTGMKVGLGFGWRGFADQSRLTGTWQACRDAISSPLILLCEAGERDLATGLWPARGQAPHDGRRVSASAWEPGRPACRSVSNPNRHEAPVCPAADPCSHPARGPPPHADRASHQALAAYSVTPEKS